jgi:hypothetical protein
MISYDPAAGLATFRGPGGFTQKRMWEIDARAIAEALGIPLEIRPAVAAT